MMCTFRFSGLAQSTAAVLLFAICCSISSCRKSEEPYRKETIPVIGRITVDGQPPGSPLQIVCHPEGEMDKEHPSVTQAISADDGSFALSTYETGDGVPPGQYLLTIQWQQFSTFSMSYGGPDKLNNRYDDPATSEYKIAVESGQEPIDLGTLELTTK